MTHTPTPWKSSGPHILARIDQTSDVVLAKTFSNGTAAFIVRAVNAHEALVEALELQDMAAREIHGKSYVNTDTQRKTVAALKLARGEV